MLRSFFDENAREESGRILLGREESHHLLTVRRARTGEPVEVLDGAGRVWRTRLAGSAGRLAELAVEEFRQVPEAGWRIELAVAVLPARPMEWLVEKATELGAAALHPLLTERGEVRLEETRLQGKTGRWRAHAVEALKQCGGPFLPTLTAPRSLAEFLAEAGGEVAWKCLASLEPDAAPLAAPAAPTAGGPPRGVLLVGPAGDFSPAEYAAARRAGWRPVTLGRQVLRAETAALAGLAIMRHLT